MRVSLILATTLLAFMMGSCTVIPTATPTRIRTKQPEPGRPLVQGQIAGVADDVLVTIHVHTPSRWEAGTFTRLGNGPWQAVMTDSDADYIVTAEAEGYVSTPVSYTIHLSGMVAYMVEGGQITTNEALHLDFHFEPAGSP